MNPAVRYVLLTFPPVLLAVMLCVLFIDKPTAINAANWLSQHSFSSHLPTSGGLLNLLTELVYLIIICWMTIYFFFKTAGKNSKFLDCLAFMSLSMAVAFFIKSTLQVFFGRYVPRYAESNILIFVRNKHLYGFHWFQAGSFPSGHMCVFGAGLTGLVLFYPKTKPIAVLLGLALGVTLILLNYHFLSDVIAGAYLGISLSIAMWHMFHTINATATLTRAKQWNSKGTLTPTLRGSWTTRT